MKKTIFQLGLWSLLLTMVFACKEEETAVEDPIASFQTETGEEGFTTINFINVSENATSSSWEFGDGSDPSTEENPVHTYAGAGSYEVTLTVTNDAGTSDAQTKTVEVEDPAARLTLLAGQESKTWSLVREGVSISHTAGWAGLQNTGARPCAYDDTFTFNRDNEFIYNSNGTFWAEYGVFNNTPDNCDANVTAEQCFEATAGNMVNACGDDVSAWLDGTHTYSYDPDNGRITLEGEGAWIGLPGLGTSAQSITPDSEVAFDAEVINGGDTGVDTLKILFAYEGISYPVTYVSYDDPALAPEIVQDAPVFGEDLADISPATMGHTFETSESFDLLGTIAGTTIITPGVEDPADATAANVGEVTRIATEYQEATLRVAPDPKDIMFDNITTVSVDVYFPSTNDYSGDLTQNFVLGFADQSQTEQWWTALSQYEETDVPLDTWTTVTFDLTAAPQTGPLVSERPSTDMIFLGFGGGGHTVEGTFYVRNLSFE